MIDALRVRLDVAVEHRRRAAHAHLVPGAMHLQPLLGRLLPAADLVAHCRIENLRAAAGDRAQPRLAQHLERLADGFLEYAQGEMPNFDGRESLDEKIRDRARGDGGPIPDTTRRFEVGCRPPTM